MRASAQRHAAFVDGRAIVTGALTVTAIDRDSRARAITETIGVGGVTMTIVFPSAIAGGATTAYLGPTADVRAGSLSVSATATNNANANADLTSVGLISAAARSFERHPATTRPHVATGRAPRVTNDAD